MTTRKSEENVVGRVITDSKKAEEQIEMLLNDYTLKFSRYCQEINSLRQVLSVNNKRYPTRRARLNDLQNRLLPQVQARLDSLQAQKGGGLI